MTRLSLNGIWQMSGGGFECAGTIPGSVYSFLLNNHLLEDPFYRQNELEAFQLMEHEFTFSRTFHFTPAEYRVLLHCDGLDTLCDIYINDVHVAYTDNMHRTYEFDVTEVLRTGENSIRIVFHPTVAYMREKQKDEPLYQPLHCTEAPRIFGKHNACLDGIGDRDFRMRESGRILSFLQWIPQELPIFMFCNAMREAMYM